MTDEELELHDGAVLAAQDAATQFGGDFDLHDVLLVVGVGPVPTGVASRENLATSLGKLHAAVHAVAPILLGLVGVQRGTLGYISHGSNSALDR